jgi:hypothetical protein
MVNFHDEYPKSKLQEFGEVEKLKWVVNEAVQLEQENLCYFNLVIDEQLHKV